MEFIKDYMKDTMYRNMLCDMTGMIFGFSFENWYREGFCTGEYIPYSYIENGKLVANVSANIMKFSHNGDEKYYIQIGTVMTRPEYRNRGLARELIEKILIDYRETAEGFYLFGNLNAVDFYKKIGFKRMDQWRWYCDKPVEKNANCSGFVPAGMYLREKYIQILNYSVCNAEFDQMNRFSLQMFYTMNMDDVYYCEELSSFAVMHIDNNALYLDSVISDRELTMSDVLSRINGEYKKIIFGFTPKDKRNLCVERYDGAEDYRLFYLGTPMQRIETDKLYFPVMSHA